MITRSELRLHSNSWQEALSNIISKPEELLNLLELDHSSLCDTLKADKQFALKVPRAFVEKMEKGNPKDPLLLQVLPLGRELDEVRGYSIDPLGEYRCMPCNGVIHKYRGRLLLIASGSCAINCRFCFRRHFSYENNQLSGDTWDRALGYIASDSSINEVILSGGDPLAANDTRLEKLVNALSDISHVETLRIHTRMPLLIPQRITSRMLQWFTSSRLKPIMVIHCNHANEIDFLVKDALAELRQKGVVLLNQTVLLKDINDSSETLIKLSKKLIQSSVMPYYLHLLDRVQGAAHFNVDEKTARHIVKDMMGKCSGYLVPKLVRDVAGDKSKTYIPL